VAVSPAAPAGRGRRLPHPDSPAEALGLLEAGNERHRRGELRLHDHSPVGERRGSEQKPFAAIITCSDSRISPTLIFDVEPGNLFVSRVAGNSIDSGTLGSTEYGVKVLGAKVVVVLAHSDCGAVKAAIPVANGGPGYPRETHGAIGDVVDAIVPPIRALPADQRSLENSTEANVRAQAAKIAASRPIIEPAIEERQLEVIAAIYEIENGQVRFL
jgi:carbonic anhydrase